MAEVIHIENLGERRVKSSDALVYRWSYTLACGHEVIEEKADKRKPKRRGITCPECGS